jgi:hypothetical protein
LAAETLLEGEAEKLTRKAIEMALDGDAVALKICLDRIYPVRKDRAVRFGLPPITSARDAADLAAGVVEAVAAGNLTPSEAAEIGKLIEIYVRAYQTAKNDRVESIHELSNEELMRIIRDGSGANTRLIAG